MIRNAQDIIDDMRNIVKPRIAKMLLEANFEGCGKEDKAEFETEFEMILTLAEKALEQEPIVDKIRAEIEQDAFKDVNNSKFISVNRINQILDKHKAEKE